MLQPGRVLQHNNAAKIASGNWAFSCPLPMPYNVQLTAQLIIGMQSRRAKSGGVQYLQPNKKRMSYCCITLLNGGEKSNILGLLEKFFRIAPFSRELGF